MKKVPSLFCLLVLVLIAGCSSEPLENGAIVQALADYELFRATNARAYTTESNQLIIESVQGDARFEMRLEAATTGAYTVGRGQTGNVSLYRSSDGGLYTTANPISEGVVTIQCEDNFVSGSFRFTALRNGISDTLTFSEGILYKIMVEERVTETLPPIVVEDAFTAKISGANFIPTIINHTLLGDTITLGGQTSTQYMKLRFPIGINPGQYTLSSETDYGATYIFSSTTETAVSGLLTIVSNDTEQRIVQGVFQFTTPSFAITDGIFAINY